jgi:hypothetical protein
LLTDVNIENHIYIYIYIYIYIMYANLRYNTEPYMWHYALETSQNTTAILKIIDVRYRDSNGFPVVNWYKKPLKADNGRQWLWDWQYQYKHTHKNWTQAVMNTTEHTRTPQKKYEYTHSNKIFHHKACHFSMTCIYMFITHIYVHTYMSELDMNPRSWHVWQKSHFYRIKHI